MNEVEHYEVSQGSTLWIDVILKDALKAPIVTYDGTETLAAKVWPGGKTPTTFNPVAIWVTPGSGKVQIQGSQDQTAATAPGTYDCLLRLTSSGVTSDAYRCTVEVTGTATN